MEKKVPIEISARHVHLSRKDIDQLFGSGYQLTKERQLTQPSDFSAKEQIGIISGAKSIDKVRIVGPERERTQIEVSLTDAISLGVQPPIRESGKLDGSSPVVLKGPNGQVELQEGLIVAARHLHCQTEEAKKLKLKNGDIISVKVLGGRSVTLHNIVVRVKDNYKLCLHLDTDEGNAAGLFRSGEGIIVKD